MTESLVFVYNADGGFFNGLADLAHKTFSPNTYACNLCKLTYSPLGMRRGWKHFLEGLPYELEFLHRDELPKELEDTALPAVFRRASGSLSTLLDAATLERCETLEALQDSLLAATQRAG